MPRLFRFARRAALALGALYALLVVLVYVFQRRLFYSGDPAPHTAASLGLDGVRDVVVPTRDGETLRALYLPPAAANRVVILYLHGSRGYLPDRAPRIKLLGRDGDGVLFLSYRGYSGSTGTPSQDGLLEDARAAHEFLGREAPGRKIVVYGESLGTGVAVKTGATLPVAGVVLDAPYTTAPEVMKSMLPFLPILTLMKDQYPTVQWITDLRAPLLVLHGTDDTRVPAAQSEQVFARAPGPKRFVSVPEAGHGDCLEGATEEVLRFLRSVD
ncbi:MAG: alpha/beta fold hydrolase [Minicystis sp.]